MTWNNCFRRVFRCCWRESIKPLQHFCNTLPISYVIDLRKLVFWRSSLRRSENPVLMTLTYINFILKSNGNFCTHLIYSYQLRFLCCLLTRSSANDKRTARPFQNFKKDLQIFGSFPSPRLRLLFLWVWFFGGSWQTQVVHQI